MSSKLKKAIGAVKDHTSISLAKVSSSSSFTNLEIAVLKATSHDDLPINDKYVTEVLQLVSSNKAHAAACARAIGKRIGRTRNWIVALKSLMLVLRIFQDGDPYFPREVLHAMKRGARILNLSSFRDDSNSSSPWDFTSFVRTFALYLDERLECFLTGKLQRRYTHKAQTPTYERSKSLSVRRPNEPMQDMKPAMLLDKMSYWQRLLDRAIATRPTGEAKTNRLIQISLYAIVEESFDLYKDLSDGLTLILDSFFHMQYQNCVTAYRTCVKATQQFEELSGFYSSCKRMGVGRISEYPSVQVISEELIETLQEYLNDQSSFSSTTSVPRQATTPGKFNPSFGFLENRSADGDTGSEHGSQRRSLQELINAAETSTTTPPAISIDLETYSEPQRPYDMGASETGSTRSLPITCSFGDLMSLDGWIVEEKIEDKEAQAQAPATTTTSGDNFSVNGWELALFETDTAETSRLVTGNTSNTGWELALSDVPAPANAENPSTGWELALFETPGGDQNQQTSAGAGDFSTEGWEMALLEGTTTAADTGWDAAAYEASASAWESNHYNPFLQDPMEYPFQAPTFSVHNVNYAMDDWFGNYAADEHMGGNGGGDPQDLQLQQQLWLQNQNKILAKNWG